MDNPNKASPATGHPELYQRLVENISDFAIYMISPEGIVSSWNAGAERFKGYSSAEIIGRHFSAFYTEEDQAIGKPERALRIARDEGKYEEEGWRRRKDDTLFWAQVVIDPLHDEDGRLVGFAKITRDITDRKRAAEEAEQAREASFRRQLEEREHLLRLFEQAPGFVCFFRGPEHVYEMANEAHAKLAQHRDIMGKPVREALPELEGQGFFELLDNVFKNAEPFVGRGWPLTIEAYPGGPAEKRFIDFVYQPVIGPDNQVIGIFSQGSDVTDQVIAQNEVKRKQEELEQLIVERTEALERVEMALEETKQLQGDKTHLLHLFDQTPGFICFLSGRQHRFELANKAYYQLVGHRDLIGKPIREVLPEIEGQGFFELLDQVFDTGEPFRGNSMKMALQENATGPLKDHYIDFIYQPILGAEGEVTGIFCQGSDVTTHKLDQDELIRYHNHLEELVIARTESLEETKEALQRAQKLESIGKLTGGVAHDFNNILQIIAGNLQLLQTQCDGRETESQRIAKALAAVERGSKLSSQLLAFARRQPLQPEVVNPGRVIRDMDDLLRRALGETIHIETVIAAGVWNAMIDPNQLENVILNLAINARDAMADGGKLTIEVGNSMLDDDYVAAKLDVPPGQYVMMAVTDTGTGMTPEVLAQACEPFFTTKPEGAGTGLGLSMAYGFVKQSGGHFNIYSEVGQGTTVKMYFPRSHEQEVSSAPPSSKPILGGTETILVVEDDLSVQATVVDMLSSLGYRVFKADNADNAMAILQSGLPIDLLFTDVVMPGKMRSPELARQAKLLMPHIEVLFTSGYTQNAIVHGGRLDPGVNLISKPYRREQLARKIRHLLSNRQQIEAGNKALSQLEADKPGGMAHRILLVEDMEDSLRVTRELLQVIGCEVEGAANGEEALALLDSQTFDILMTDYNLPDINGLDLAIAGKEKQPKLKVVFASGYGDAFEKTPPFRYVSLPKPYDLEKLTEAIQMAASLQAS